ncbi:probable small intestine urate exporter [Balaenoptera ricei]|uniref:probable small intestine urate exporter n=1 Tax=Balaenoptera ricei TaxID=2746895 RepID=UPI0028BF0E1C|nr:probable small intestine urate exporter [Balaenoptera ricei]
MFTTVEAEATVGGIVNDGTLNTAQVQTFKKGFCSVRHGLALIVHLCNFSISTQQMNMSIALPAMVNNTAPPSPPSISTERPPTDFQDNWNETLNEFKAVQNACCGIGCICSFLWFALIYDDPVNHPFISTSEKEYIICSLAQEDSPPGWSLPIKAIIKSLLLWSILVFYFSDYWHYFVIRSYLPTYISSVLQANIRDSGMLSALPFVSAGICIVPGGLLADFLLSRKILSLNTIRKVFTAIGVLLLCAFFVSLFWVRSSFSATMAFLILSSATKSLSQSGALVNFMDIAPRMQQLHRAGSLKGLVNFRGRAHVQCLTQGTSQIFSYIAGAISPTVAGLFISQDSEFGWRNVFLLSAAVNIAGLFFYLIFGQAEVQDWAKGRCAPASEQTE